MPGQDSSRQQGTCQGVSAGVLPSMDQAGPSRSASVSPVRSRLAKHEAATCGRLGTKTSNGSSDIQDNTLALMGDNVDAESSIGKRHAEHSPSDGSLLGKRTRIASPTSNSVDDLLTRQFSDSTQHGDYTPVMGKRRSSTSASGSTASYLRAATGAPAEGPGLRGADHEVQETSNGDPSASGTSLALPRSADMLAVGSSAVTAYPPNAKTLCIRHQSMADEGKTAKLQKSIESLPIADQTAVNTVWSLFSSSPHPRRALMIQGLLTMCCSSQLSLLSSELSLAIRLDPFMLFPREVSLKILKYLDAMSLGRAAQVSRTWKGLADDDLLWRNMCEQHIERKCEKCGWGLPLLSERRRRAPPPTTNIAPSNARSSSASSSSPDPIALGVDGSQARDGSATGSLKRHITAAANKAAHQRNASKSVVASRSSSPAPPALTRPWKSVYCERLAIERNWRRGRYSVKVLSGHQDGIMCLQFSESLSHPTFPVVITGSYDRTARVWNMETGEQLRVLKGHTRGVRCLQFDEAKLITGSMDRTLKIWNWRTGELMRTLEGHTEGIVCLHYNNDILASGSADSNVKIWNFRSGECFTLRGHTDWVNAVLLWSGKRKSLPASTSHVDDGTASTFLFSASDDGTIRMWDLATRESLMSYDGHVGQVQSIRLVMLDETAIHKLVLNAAGGTGADHAETIQRREMREQRLTRSAASAAVEQAANASHSYFPHVESPHGQSSDEEDAEEDADARAGGQIRSPRPEGTESCGYNPSAVPGGRAAGSGTAPALPDRFTYLAGGSQLASESETPRKAGVAIDNTLQLTHKRLLEAGLVEPLPVDAEMTDLEGPLNPAWDADRASNQRRSNSHHPPQRPVLISASLDNTIRLWCVRTGRCIRTLFGHTEGIWSLSLDRLRIASASHDRCIKTWDMDTGMCKQTFVGHRGAVTCVQLGDDKIVSGSDDSECRIWSFAPQQT